MRRTFSLPTREAALDRGAAFQFLAYAAQLRAYATTGKRRQAMDHREALRLARSTDARAERGGLRLP